MHLNRSSIPKVIFAVLAATVVLSAAFACDDVASVSSADSSFTPTYYDAEVTPFTFPESKGAPILKALSKAESTVDISIYYMGSEDVIALLCDLEELEGVDVRVLVLGNPLGVNTDSEMSMLKKLESVGGEVNVINYPGCPSEDKRYTYVHNKYAVIDGDTVVITSENWTKSNLGKGGNRGWGAVIESTGYATHMKGIFEGDYAVTNPDVKRLDDAFPDIPVSGEISYILPDSYPTPTYSAKVAPVTSPDNSKSALRYFMESATGRLYVEQLDIDKKNASLTDDSLVRLMADKAEGGVDVKYILNGTYETSGNVDEAEHHALVQSLNGNTKVKAAIYEKTKAFPQIHNKGVIADDKVWVGSVNWTESSFLRNREAAVMIDSPEVTSYYADYFDTDFNNAYNAGYSKAGLDLEENKYYIGGALAAILALLAAFVRKSSKTAVRSATSSGRKSGSGSKSSKKGGTPQKRGSPSKSKRR